MVMASQVDTKEGREWTQSLLKSQEVTISFTKKDGTKRKMFCTLAENKIPSEKMPKNSGKSVSDDALAVFDIEKNDRLSFPLGFRDKN